MALRSPCFSCERAEEDKSQDICVECAERKAYAKLDDQRGILTTFELEGIVRPIRQEEKLMTKPVTVTKKVFHPEPVCRTCGIFPQTTSKKGQRTGYCAGCIKKRMAALQASKTKKGVLIEEFKTFPGTVAPVSYFLEITCPKCGEKHSVTLVVGG